MSALDTENMQVLNLVQALLGAVSPNFRAVSLRCDGGAIVLTFLLAQDLPEDREEIEDLQFEFQALQSRDADVDTEIVVSAGPLESVGLPGRLVFLRREQPSA